MRLSARAAWPAPGDSRGIGGGAAGVVPTRLAGWVAAARMSGSTLLPLELVDRCIGSRIHIVSVLRARARANAHTRQDGRGGEGWRCARHEQHTRLREASLSSEGACGCVVGAVCTRRASRAVGRRCQGRGRGVGGSFV